MKKNTDFEEFLNQLENAMNNIMDEIDEQGGLDILDDRPVNINISINVFPVMPVNMGMMGMGQGMMAVRAPGKTPVDVIETEQNVHAVIKIPDMDRETISLNEQGNLLEITALSGSDTISEIIELPARVNKSGMTATYKNGILEVVLNKPKCSPSV